jgi:hypothetical protein
MISEGGADGVGVFLMVENISLVKKKKNQRRSGVRGYLRKIEKSVNGCHNLTCE